MPACSPVPGDRFERGTRGPAFIQEATSVSIVRVGLAETKRYSEGYEAIFGKKPAAKEKAVKKTNAKKKKSKKK
jgi:hypothetical protein